MRLSTLTSWAWLIGGCAASAAGAQTVEGSVIDSISGNPIGGVTVLVIDTSDPSRRQGFVTDSTGTFSIALPHPGSYEVSARRLGYRPVTSAAASIAAGASRRMTFAMVVVPMLLDTVRARSPYRTGFMYKLTTGQEWFSRHYREGKGFFTSGDEILLSGVNACDYFGHMPGYTLIGLEPIRGEQGIGCTDGRFVIRDDRPSCMRAMLDRIWVIAGIDSANILIRSPRADSVARSLRTGTSFGGVADTIPWSYPISAIQGIEAYRDRASQPDDFSMLAEQIPAPVSRSQLPGQAMTMGPPVPMIPAMPISQCGLVVAWSSSYW
jgi:hypothetical protein